MPPFFYNFSSSCERQSLSFVNAIFFINFLYFIRMAELRVWKCLHYFTMFSSHPHGKAYRFYMPPFFYNFSSTCTRQSLGFVNAPIVTMFSHIGKSEHCFWKCPHFFNNFSSSCERQSLTFVNAIFFINCLYFIRIAGLRVWKCLYCFTIFSSLPHGKAYRF